VMARENPWHGPEDRAEVSEGEREDEEQTDDETQEESRVWEDLSYGGDRGSVEYRPVDDVLEQAIAHCEAAYAELH